MSNLERIRPDIEHIIESAYQDMRGVMNGKKGYRLRHTELTDAVLLIAEKEINRKAREQVDRWIKP